MPSLARPVDSDVIDCAVLVDKLPTACADEVESEPRLIAVLLDKLASAVLAPERPVDSEDSA